MPAPVPPARALALALAAVAVAACPVTPGAPLDGGAPDSRLVITEAGLARCAVPDERCTPADPCGLNARCGRDLLCRASGRRDCDDGVACTRDRCVSGGCVNEVLPGFCLIDDSCHVAGTSVTCGRCDPLVSAIAWAPVSGKSCDDGDLCTRGDECRQGVCVGQLYSCSDGLACTTDACDGVGGCHHYLRPGHCLIESLCYKQLQTDPTGCQVCDPTNTAVAWSPRANSCTIAGGCHGAGDADPTGCYTCDPVHTTAAWTPLPAVCFVGAGCVAADTTHPSKCGHCDPTRSTKYWSPAVGGALVWSGFAAGPEGWAVTPLTKDVGWQTSSARAFSAPASLYYGSLTTKSFDSGGVNSGVATAPAVALPSNQKAFLSLQLYIDVEKTNDFDVLTVRVNGKDQWVKNTTTVTAASYKSWLPVLLELTAFAGQTVTVQLLFETKDALNNAGEGIYVDDVTIFMGCGKII